MTMEKTTSSRRLVGDRDKIFAGLQFLTKHFQDGLTWPRTISTKRLDGAQIPVYSMKEAMIKFDLSDGQDCRINAYPAYMKAYQSRDANKSTMIGVAGIFADLLFMDIDLGGFLDEQALDDMLFTILDRIDKLFHQKCKPSVSGTGNGYHIYQPVQLYGPSLWLAHVDMFRELGGKEVDRKFLQWAEQHLSNGQADPQHSKGLSFNNCLMRVPGSINTKESCIPGKEEVRIVQPWDGQRPHVNWLLRDFRDYLTELNYSNSKKRRAGVNVNAGLFSTNWRRYNES